MCAIESLQIELIFRLENSKLVRSNLDCSELCDFKLKVYTLSSFKFNNIFNCDLKLILYSFDLKA